ncbi:glycosyltransferase family 4 protein [bacterium]|nr:glycosyltransferase family 4 protein [bacterium]
MKVLLLTNSNFSSHLTSEHLLEAVLKQTALPGNEVHVVQMLKKDGLLTLPSSVEGLNVTTEAVYTKPQNKTNLLTRYLNAVRNYFHCRKALKTHSDSEAVFVQSTNVAGFAVWLVRKYIKNATITYNVQDILPYNLAYSGKLKKNSLVFKVLAAVQRYAYKHADHIITISEDMKETLVADGTDASKIEVIYNWSYQDELYENVDLTSVSHMFNKDFFNVVYAGNIGVMQNVDILIEAAKLMKGDDKVWFHIIGNGVYKEKLEARAKEYGITNISFWPMQPPELAPAIYSAADVNVIPLVKDVYRTALPSKTATCLACQKPIIFAIGKESRFGQKIAKEAGCQVVEADDSEELVEAIRKVQSGGTANKEGEFFLNYCGITENSRKYAEIIGEI